MSEIQIYAVDGTTGWYLNGRLHRTDGPAIEGASGFKVWYLNGQRHRTDGPAFEYTGGRKEWYLNGHRHRTDGPAIEDEALGFNAWFLNGQRLKDRDLDKQRMLVFTETALAVSPLGLPPYPTLWVLQATGYYDGLDERKLVKYLEGIANSRRKLNKI